ncbi:hypothetical protein [Acinetobacter sp.]|uniref:hypothetical protein n=1 Tax=Acinetobacter sp. TaxID=472 RepID=UPI00333FFC77
MSRKRTHVEHFDMFAQIISFAVNNKRRIGTNDLIQLVGLSPRSSQRHLSDLAEAGWLIKDNCTPRGYVPTDKAKKLFKVAL